jgi:hypothetical protein
LKPANPFGHSERKHSKFSASGAERWFNCPGSVALSEGMPDTSNVYSEEGTWAHEYLELYLRANIKGRTQAAILAAHHAKRVRPIPMQAFVAQSGNSILERHAKKQNSELLVETRITLDWIHPEMFGTFDAGDVEMFGTLDVYDFKYGQGHIVSPTNNLQLLFYAVGLAHRYDWNFEYARMYIIQPRAKGYSEPVYWELPIKHVRSHANSFKEAVERVEKHPNQFKEGSWCHWCKAKKVCPLKVGAKEAEAKRIFGI